MRIRIEDKWGRDYGLGYVGAIDIYRYGDTAGNKLLACAMGGHSDVDHIGENDLDTTVFIVGRAVSLASS